MFSSDDDYEIVELESLDISNDQYYGVIRHQTPRILSTVNGHTAIQDVPVYGSLTIKHSLPAYDLWRPFFPTYLSEEKFHNFHRPKLRHYNLGPQIMFKKKRSKYFPIKNLAPNICKFQKSLRGKVIRALNDGVEENEIHNQLLRINKAKDLTAKHGELFLFEYSEEHPPVLSQIGMAANIKTLIESPQQNTLQLKNLSKQDELVPVGVGFLGDPIKITNRTLVIGSDEFISKKNTTKQVYFNQLKPGTRLQVLENNMYRAPIYEHEVPSCDFLIIRTRNSFYVREIPKIFVVGQTMPLVTIPQPTENNIQKFRCDLSNVHINRLFYEGHGKINFQDLAKMFPDYARSNLRSRLLKSGARPLVTNSPIIERGKSKYGLANTRDLRRSFTPEQYCLNMSMLAARQRLRELNYTESMIIPNDETKVEIEVLSAPWNTSKAVIGALSGRNYLDFKEHVIDPTGPQREGFSCIAWSKSPTEDAQKMIRQHPQEKNSSTNNSLFIDKNPLLQQIKREKLERLAIYQREAQIISQVQSNVLSSKEVLSSDEDDIQAELDDEEEDAFDSKFDEQLMDLSKLIIDGQTVSQLDHEKEERERLLLLNSMMSNDHDNVSTATKNDNINLQGGVKSFKGRILKITRTYQTTEGTIQSTEIVREPRVIALYIKQKGGNDCNSQSVCSITTPSSTPIKKRIQQSGKRLIQSQDSGQMRKSLGLGPTELCRADGVVLTISKKVLDPREMRRRRRQSSVEV